MPRMGKGKQVKVFLPKPLYQMLAQEADRTGRPMAEILREQVADRYGDELMEYEVIIEEEPLAADE